MHKRFWLLFLAHWAPAAPPSRDDEFEEGSSEEPAGVLCLMGDQCCGCDYHRPVVHVKLEGELVDEEERITDPELLAEIMELREAVDEADDTQSLNAIQAQLQEKLRYWSNAFREAYLNKNYEDALASIRRMTYYRRANEEIVKKV
ncbi:hypothetical protein PHJA_001638500 [Phtheirospermum japonicum]|uniref:Co-chaperone HscB C-terminal oligomerisation domain-containing protein n=1 Tax=Phtheirospermum japonicum TaxID=374723 RepID=A0A830CKM5_9LAMI|nr:hypothetical protein PHJA_001638500 [Phtheirospermum japonicum]